MAIKLGSNPKEFSRDVEIIKLDGCADKLKITFIYRAKRDFAQMLDDRRAAEKAQAEAEAAELKAAVDAGGDIPVKTVLDGYLDFSKKQAEQVQEIAKGWDLSDEFSTEKLMQLEDEFPGALEAVQMAYQKAVAEVRVKN